MEKINYEGQKFGNLTVLKEGEGLFEGKKKRRSVIYECDCGNQKEVLLRQIKRGKLKSCGCLLKKEIIFNIGDIIGFWAVVGDGKEYVSPKGGKLKTTKVKCICGKEREVISSILNTGKSSSCGCKGAPKKEKVEKIIPQDTEEEKWKQSDICVNYYFSSLGKVFNYNKQEYLDSNKSFIKYKRKKEVNITKELARLFLGEYCDKEYKLIFLDGNNKNRAIHNMYLARITSNGINWLKRLYSNSKFNKKEFNISYEEIIKQYEKQKGLSYFLKIPLDLTMEDKLRAISIDRKDNSIGYESNNFTLVTRFENMGRNSNLFEDMEKFCNENFTRKQQS